MEYRLLRREEEYSEKYQVRVGKRVHIRIAWFLSESIYRALVLVAFIPVALSLVGSKRLSCWQREFSKLDVDVRRGLGRGLRRRRL